jgi:23S rRNA (uracil1939-C5)-methyltransferase
MTTPSAIPPRLDFGPDGQAVVCAHAEQCGGCPLMGVPYAQQLELKRNRLVQAMARYASLETVVPETVVPARPVAGYRTRAKLIVAPGGALGLFAKGGGHQVVDIPHCLVLAPALARVAAHLRQSIVGAERAGGPLAPFGPQTKGALRAVDLREAVNGDEGRVLVTFVVERSRVAGLSNLETAAHELMRAVPQVVGVAANLHDGDQPQILGNETVTLAGTGAVEDRVGASVHLATFGSFVQAHRGQAGTVHRLIAEAIGLTGGGSAGGLDDTTSSSRPLRVLDLYGGSGSIALALAGMGAQVKLVETFPPAVAQARAAAEAQKLPVHAECADVAESLRALSASGARFDAAVLNPPRRGTSPSTREWLARLEPKVLVYVSCDPETLGRDLDHFARLGYRTESLRPLDMIPLTDEIETVAVLRHAGVEPARVAYEDDQVLIVEKGPHEPTTPQGEYAGSLLMRVRRIPGAEEAVPVHRLDVGTGGLVIFARKPEYAAQWAQVLVAPTTRKIYVAAVRGIAPAKGAVTRELRENGKTYPARTRYRRLGVAARHSVLRVIPDQGRTHQIRRHLAAIGHPILGDDRYGDAATNRHFAEKNGLDRAFLHCVRLEVDHPVTGARLVVETPLAGDLRAVLERTSGAGTVRFLDHKNALGRALTSTLPPPSVVSAEHDEGGPLDIDTRPSMLPEVQRTGDDPED